jgi:hypothetical protein
MLREYWTEGLEIPKLGNGKLILDVQASEERKCVWRIVTMWKDVN